MKDDSYTLPNRRIECSTQSPTGILSRAWKELVKLALEYANRRVKGACFLLFADMPRLPSGKLSVLFFPFREQTPNRTIRVRWIKIIANGRLKHHAGPNRHLAFGPALCSFILSQPEAVESVH